MKLISLNIEGDNHLDRVMSFLKKENPDVICLQEVFGKDLSFFSEALSFSAAYVPMMTILKENSVNMHLGGEIGIAILSRYPLTNISSHYYVGNEAELPEFIDSNANAARRMLLRASITDHNHDFTFITTHFTWSPGGSVTELQRDHVQKMLQLLAKEKEFVLCGDFNAPRGKDIFAALAEKYRDNIPLSYTTSLDPQLHRVKNLQFMVDGLFSTPRYNISSVSLVAAVSDHMAIVAQVEKKD